MSNSKLSPKEQEELNKLENEALQELYQIIAIAYEVQDIKYIDSMISAWKNKYKKVLDTPSPDFKKKIEKLLNESYSQLITYILSQIKLKEEKLIQNQRKALNELYNIVKDNYDLDTVKRKLKTWEEKYPYDSFLKMYQKRIDATKRDKNLKQHAFDQEAAFKDLYYGVINRSGTIKELKDYLSKWEEKYSINDKFTIDHFIKHQSEIKRYVSDEYLISIATIVKKEEPIIDDFSSVNSDSNPDIQASACKQLESIIKGNYSIDAVFKWVYKNNSIKFNDYYKQRIINATSFDYSPKYLKSLPVPDIDLTKPALPIEQYTKINEIKRYAIISYFNLLLPKNEAISNNFFTEHIRTIYYETEKRKHSNIINTFKDEVTNFVPETLNEEKETDLDLNTTDNIEISAKTDQETDIDLSSSTIDISTKKEQKTTLTIENNVLDIEQLILSNEEPNIIEIVTPSKDTKPIEEDLTTSKTDSTLSDVEEYTTSKTEIISSNAPKVENYETKTTDFIKSDNETLEKHDTISFTVSTTETDLSEEEPIIYEPTTNTSSTDIYTTDAVAEEPQPNIDYDTIIAFSPVFFETINNYSIQAQLVQNATNKIVEKNKARESFAKSDIITKTRNQSE